MNTLYDFSATTLDGRPISLDAWRGKVALIVNTASKCGFTPQYEGLELLHREFREQGFEVLAFPCNQFRNQEPGGAMEIASFCQRHYGVSFQMFDKIQVNGADAHPLYKWLKSAAPGILGIGAIKWNFTKFLIGRDGRVVRRYAPITTPQHIAADIRRLLTA